MSKQITLLRVFVASPGDLEPERQALEQEIKDINIILGKTRNIQLELVKWETHAYPNVGKDLQSVINEQISNDYDIFIGVLWKRFGTPTPRAMSGTDEEFMQAYSRFQENSDSLRILIYFKETPVPPNELDPSQLVLLKKFRDSLGEKGALYWTYTETEEFTRLARLHLLRHIADYEKTWGIGIESKQTEIETVSDSETSIIDIDIEDHGFLDLIEIGVENFNASGETAEEIVLIMEEFTEKIEHNTDELNSLPKPVNSRLAKRIINRSADELDHLSARLQIETPRLTEKYAVGLTAYGRAAEILLDFDLENKPQVEDSVEVVHTLKNSLLEMQDSITTFRNSIQTLPRITTKFNRAKRNALSVVESFIDDLTITVNLTIEIEKAMKRFLTEGTSIL